MCFFSSALYSLLRNLYSSTTFSALLLALSSAFVGESIFLIGLLQVFPYFIKSCYHFIKLLALVLILLKQEQGEPLYLLIIHTFKGCMFFWGLSIISSRCLRLSVFSMSSSSFMSSKFYVKILIFLSSP